MTVGTLQRTPGKRRQRTIGGGGAATGLRLPGTSGNYISTPNSVLNSITGDIDIRVYAKLGSWATVGQTFIAKFGGGGARSFLLRINSSVASRLEFLWTQDGSTVIAKSPASTLSFANGTAGWIRVTLDVDNGAGGNDLKFYTSTDGIIWTQFDSTITTAGVTNIADTSQVLELGANTGGTSGLLVGTVYYAEVRNGIDGPVVAKFDSSQAQVSGSQLPASINGWTWNGSALYKRDDYVRLPGTSGNYLSFPDTVANSVTGDIDLRAKCSADNWTPAATTYVIGKEVVGARSYCMGITSAGKIEFRFSLDGTNPIAVASTVGSGIADGTVSWIRATRAAATDLTNFYTSPDGVTWTLLGTGNQTLSSPGNIADTTPALELGSRVTGTANLWAGKVYYAEVRNGIDGTVVASFDARSVQTPWTVNGAAWNWEGSSFTGKPGIALSLPGTSGNYASTPDTAGNSVTGDIDLRWKGSLDNWTTPATSFTLVGKRTATGNQRSYRLEINVSGRPILVLSQDGTTETTATASVATGIANGATKWVRATWRASNGRVQFFLSDDGTTWTQLGADQTIGLASIFDSTALVEVGSTNTGANNIWSGKVYYAEVRNGIDGPIVAMFDPARMAKTGTRTPASTVQPGGTPNLLTPNQASIETDATGWASATNAPTLAQNATQFLDGTKSLSLTATAAGPANMEATTGAAKFPLVGGKEYTVKASFRAAVTPRSCQVKLWWYDNTNTFISAGNSGTVTDSTSAWSEVSSAGLVSFKAPANAVAGVVVLTVQNAVAGEVHYVDRVSLVEAASTWTINGSAWDLVAV